MEVSAVVLLTFDINDCLFRLSVSQVVARLTHVSARLGPGDAGECQLGTVAHHLAGVEVSPRDGGRRVGVHMAAQVHRATLNCRNFQLGRVNFHLWRV